MGDSWRRWGERGEECPDFQAGGYSLEERRSNIYKLYRATRVGPDSPINPAEQIAYYDAGLGSRRPGGGTLSAIYRSIHTFMSQATGFGITTNLIGLVPGTRHFAVQNPMTCSTPARLSRLHPEVEGEERQRHLTLRQSHLQRGRANPSPWRRLNTPQRIIERIRQLVPFNQLDGSWLERITRAGTNDLLHRQ